MTSTTVDSTPGVLDWVFFWKHPSSPQSHSNKEGESPTVGEPRETVVVPEHSSKGHRPSLTRDDNSFTNFKNLLHRSNSLKATKKVKHAKVVVATGTKHDETDPVANETPDAVRSSITSTPTSPTSPSSSFSHKENSPQSRVEEHSNSRRPSHVNNRVERIVDVLDTVFHQTPKIVISPVTKLFRFDDETIAKSHSESLKHPPVGRDLNRGTSRILMEHIVAPPPIAHHHGFWGTLYRNLVTEFGTMALMHHFSWIGHIFTFLWMLLPTSIVVAMWNHVVAYFRRLRDAIASNFRLPKRLRDPFKKMKEYMELDLGGPNEGGGKFKYALLMGATAFAYQTQQGLGARSRRAKRRRR
jgi:hypothetical protein